MPAACPMFGGALGLAAVALGALPGQGWEATAYSAWLVAHLLGWAKPPADVGLRREVPILTPPANGSILEVQGWPGPSEFKERYLWSGPVIFRGAATAQNGWNLECLSPAGSVESRAIAFFTCFFVLLLTSLMINATYQTKPTRLLLALRAYQAYGHFVYAFGRGNDFTKFSAQAGCGLLCDGVGFLVEGVVYKHPPFFCWGCYHFSHWVIQKALPLLSTSLIEAKGIVFWSHLLADNVFNIWTFVFLARHLSHRASFAEGAVGSTSDNVPPGPEYRGCGLMKKLPLPCKKRGFQAVLIIFGAVSVWTLLNED